MQQPRDSASGTAGLRKFSSGRIQPNQTGAVWSLILEIILGLLGGETRLHYALFPPESEH